MKKERLYSLDLLRGLDTDIYKWRRGLSPVILFGQYALTAYLLHTLFAPALRAFANVFVQGLPRFFGADAQVLVLPLAESVLIVLALLAWRRIKTGVPAGRAS